MRSENEERAEDARAAALLRALPPVAPAAVARVRARLHDPARTSRAPVALVVGTTTPRRLVVIGTVTLLMAASALLLVRRSLEPVPEAPAALAVALETGGGWGIVNSIPNVGLSYDGVGTVAGASDAPQIQWDAGTINVEVVPERGVRLAVKTREAEVRVIGTGFTVARDALGTRVEVRHGRVEVDCGGELTRLLEAGDEVNCVPTSASGLLGRARALQMDGAAPNLVLETLDNALAMNDVQAATIAELSAARVRALFDLGRHADAVDAARTFLTSGATGTRAADVLSVAAASSVALGGCAIAAPWLLELAPERCAE